MPLPIPKPENNNPLQNRSEGSREKEENLNQSFKKENHNMGLPTLDDGEITSGATQASPQQMRRTTSNSSSAPKPRPLPPEPMDETPEEEFIDVEYPEEEEDSILNSEIDEYPEEETVVPLETQRTIISASQASKNSSNQKSVADKKQNPVEESATATVSKNSLRKSKKDKKNNFNSEQPDYIDKKNLKLLPFGTGSKKEKAANNKSKISIEERKDLQKRNDLVRYIVLAVLVGILGLACYNTLVPHKTLSTNDVSTIVNNTTGNTGFPMERGRGFATDFMKAYLTADSTDPNSVQALGYYYSGGQLQAQDSPNRSFNNIKQTVLYGPTVYQATGVTSYSATYVIGAYTKMANVSNTTSNSASSTPTTTSSGSATATPSSTPTQTPTPSSTSTSKSTALGDARWSFFSVNVYYNKAKDNFTITGDSPTVVPAVDVGAVSDLPQEATIGNGAGSDELNGSIKSTVLGFVKAYQGASVANHTDMDQYIIPNPPADLVNGLNNRYTIDGGADNGGVQFTSFTTSDPNVVKAQVVINWRDGGATTGSGITYKSTYVMTLQKQPNGKYLVAKFIPIYFFKQ